MPATKGKRVVQFTKALGGSAGGGVAGAAGKASAAYFDAEARKEVARQEAEANKVKYQQQTHQAAIAENANILHELDGAMLRLEGNLGTEKKPMPVSLKLSILGAYGLANLVDAAMQDAAHREAGNWENADHVSMTWQDARTPRTDKFRYSEPRDTPAADAAAAAAAAGVSDNAAKKAAAYAAAAALLARGDIFGYMKAKAAADAMPADSGGR